MNKNILSNNTLSIDRVRIEIVLNNLISNAIKYHKKEGDRWVKISVIKLTTVLKFRIEDNDVGIEKVHQDKIFDMFYRGNEKSEGSGLGLYIVNDVINKMNGEISLRSKTGEGTMISFTVPIE